MDNKILCHPIEIHITHNCNMKCYGCNHYCNYQLKNWFITEKEFEEWIKLWAERIIPSTFNILGGEPTLHPNLCNLLEIAGKYFKSGKYDYIGKENPICLITNGSFLQNHNNLKNILLKNNIRIFLSLHYNKKNDILKILNEWKKDGVSISICDYSIHKEWRKFYKNYGKDIEPYEDNKIELSWKKCTAKKYFQLFDGKIWKCANIAYLSLVKEKFNISEKWNKYLKYQPLELNNSNENIISFFNMKHEFICNMCPSNPYIIDNIFDDIE